MECTPRHMLDKLFLTPFFDAFPCFVYACRLLPTQNVAQQCRGTVKTHLLRSGKQLAAEYASCSHSQGLRKGGDAAPCSRRSQAWGGVASSSPYLHATRPSGRISCGSSVKRIDGWREHRCSKEGKPVGGRATTITANRERGASISYAPPTPRRWWSGTRGTAAPMHRVRPRRCGGLW